MKLIRQVIAVTMLLVAQSLPAIHYIQWHLHAECHGDPVSNQTIVSNACRKIDDTYSLWNFSNVTGASLVSQYLFDDPNCTQLDNFQPNPNIVPAEHCFEHSPGHRYILHCTQ